MDGWRNPFFLSSINITFLTVDIFTQHFYPHSTSLLEAAAQVAAFQKKVFVAGEDEQTDHASAAPPGTPQTTAITNHRICLVSS
ncbi:hypothetical protein [Dictyobacter aurantiacus]|uniref:Uncharacterized protein n=1 Tax=Dictyobacter aurantiacus TaxID=1936993 RepID=A0A401ZPR7_9CHLR|nr:hypothetical protein [Dictyobacter aurantiacus]GCE08869.1 hypothetical protein KDAU_61980 [Dictyobacter aurantiacus]